MHTPSLLPTTTLLLQLYTLFCTWPLLSHMHTPSLLPTIALLLHLHTLFSTCCFQALLPTTLLLHLHLHALFSTCYFQTTTLSFRLH